MLAKGLHVYNPDVQGLAETVIRSVRIRQVVQEKYRIAGF